MHRTLNTVHRQTDRCGFDRNSSISEDRYVCDCGWRDPTIERKLRYSRKQLYQRTKPKMRAK